MISRRLIRIKVLQILYAFQKTGETSLTKAEKELYFSVGKAFDLYHYLLLLIVDVARYSNSRIELALQKNIKTFEDLHPNTRFVENRVIQQIENNAQFSKYIEEKKLSWVNYPELIKKLYNELSESDFFKTYMDKPESSYKNDKELVLDFYCEIVPKSELFIQTLEEQSIYWNDDIEFTLNMLVKSLQHFKKANPEGTYLMSLYKNDEDKDFVKQLFRKCIVNQNELKTIIHDYTTNWEVERIAQMDILIMMLALTEILYFPSIPVRVSLNEYIEISKFYSTEKSSVFINGVLDKIVGQFRKEKKIKKAGRGLIGEDPKNF